MKKLKFLLVALLCFVATGQCFAEEGAKTDFWLDGLHYTGNTTTRTCTLDAIDPSITNLVVPNAVRHPQVGELYEVKAISVRSQTNVTLQSIKFEEKLVEGIDGIGTERYLGVEEINYLDVNFVGTEITFPTTLKSVSNLLYPTAKNYYVAEGNEGHPTPTFQQIDGVLYDKATGKTLVMYPPAKIFGEVGTYYQDSNNTIFKIKPGVEIVLALLYSRGDIETLIVPASVKELDTKQIVQLLKLKNIYVEDGNTEYSNIDNDGVLYTYDQKTLLTFPQQHPVDGTPAIYIVHEKVDNVATFAFFDSKTIDVLDLNNVKSVAPQAAHTGIIGTIIIPACLIDIPSNSLVPRDTYEVRSGNPAYAAVDGLLYERIYDKTKNYAKYDPKTGEEAKYLQLIGIPKKTNNFTYVAPEDLLVIGGGVFTGKTLTGVKFNAALEKLDVNAFCYLNSPNLDLDFTNTNLWYIGSNCFIYATFHTVTLPQTLKEMGYAFRMCKMTDENKTITIPSSVERISSGGICGFISDSNVKKVIFEEGCDATKYDFTHFASGSSLEEIVWNGLKPTTLGDGAFMGCQELGKDPEKPFVLPASVKSLGKQCFYNANIENFTIEEGSVMTSIATNCFEYAGIKKINLPLSVVSIEEAAFRNCPVLQEINIGKDANNIHPLAFQGCMSLTAINVDEACTTYSSSDGMLLNKAKTELVIYPAGRNGEKFNMLPPSLTTIGDQAFYYNTNIKHIVIPNKVTKIGEQAFWLCKNLESVTMLCDNAINPANIGQGENKWSFSKEGGEDSRKDIILYVREGKYDDFVKEGDYNDYYSKFNGGAIIKSFWTKDEKGEETEEYINVSNYAYSLLSVKSKDWTYSIPEKASGTGYPELPVMLIGDYAFQDTPEYAEGTELTPKSGIREVIVPENVEYIGAKAFLNKGETTIDGMDYRNASTIRNIFLLSDEPGDVLATLRYKLGPDHGTKDYNEAVAGQHIYMKKSAWEKADTQADWNKYKDIISYQVPMQIDATYETLSREFDVEIDPEEVQNCKVLAYAGNAKSNDPDDPCEFYISLSKTEGTYYLRCYNIDVKGQDKNGEEVSYQGTYIPRKMGVVLKVFSEDKKTPDGYFVRIAEKQKLALDTDKCGYSLEDNVLQYVTTNPMGLDIPEEGKPSTFVLQGGQLCDISETGPTEVNAVIRKTDSASDTYAMAIHKAYMSLSPSPEPPYVPTAIEEIEVDGGADQPAEFYNLAGQRVNYPTNGFYIRRIGDKAEKVFVK